MSSIIGELTGTNAAASSAMNAQREAAAQSNATQERMYNQQRTDSAGYRTAGDTALGKMQDPSFQKSFTMDDYQADPGYAFRLQQGQQALERSAAAKGGLQTGGTLKELTNYSQGAASQEYGAAYDRFNNDQSSRFGRLSKVADMGLQATGQIGQAAQNYGNNVSQTQMGLGNAQAASIIGAGNANAAMFGQAAGAGLGFLTGGASKVAEAGASGGGGDIGNYPGKGALGSGAMRFSDERLKENVSILTDEDRAELRSTLKAVRYHYKNSQHGSGEQIGIMAQDLEKTKIGRTLVTETSDGFKQIDLSKVLCLFLADLAGQ